MLKLETGFLITSFPQTESPLWTSHDFAEEVSNSILILLRNFEETELGAFSDFCGYLFPKFIILWITYHRIQNAQK